MDQYGRQYNMALTLHGNNGVITTNGTAAAPSFAAPDNDTGLFYGTDLIGFSTGGTERLRINSSGNTQFGGLANGGNYQDGYARNVIDLGSATLNRGIGWGGSNANYANIWTEYSTGDLNLGQGVRPKGSNTGWFSSYGGGSIGRGVINFDMSTGDIRFYNAASSTVSAGSSVSTPEKLRILSTGEVLINRTAKPNDINKLVVTGTSPADSYDSTLYLEGSETSGAINTGGALAFGGHDGSAARNWGNIYGMKENATGGNTAGYMSFHTRAAGGNPAEKVRIDSVGRVIIGATTVAPANSYSNNLVVSEASGDVGMQFVGNNSNSNYASLYFGDAGAASRAYFESQLGSNGNFTIGINGTGPIRFNNNNGEQLRIDNGGRLLIGATTTRAQAGGNPMLQIEKASSEGMSLLRKSNDAGAIWLALSKSRSNAGAACQAGDHIGAIGFYPHDGTDLNHASADIRGYVESGIQGNDTPGDLRFHTNPGQTTTVERMRIDSQGRVSVGRNLSSYVASGMSSAANDFIVTTGAGSNGGMSIVNSGADIGNIFFAEGTSENSVGRIQYEHSNNALSFTANSAERLRIDSSGNVTIPSTDAKLILKDGNNYIQFVNADKDFKFMNAWGAGEFTFHVNGAERLRITAGGKIGLNYAGVPPSEDVMICASGQAAPAAASLSHLSGGNRYGTRFSTISGTNSGVVVYTQFNSSYIERQRIQGDGNTYFYDHNADARLVMESDGDFKVSNPGWGTTSSPSTSSFQGLSQLGHQHWGHRQYYSKQFNLSQNGTQDLISNNTAHDDIIFWLNVKGYHANRTFAAVHGTIGGYGITYHSQHGASGAGFSLSANNIASGRNQLRFTSTSSHGAQWWVWGWISGTSGTGTHTGMTAKQLH